MSRRKTLICPFQSTLLVRGATKIYANSQNKTIISIHAPRERSDRLDCFSPTVLSSISIHAPRERSDVIKKIPGSPFGISIHAPRERSDCGINKKYPQPVFILHKYWIFSDIFQRFWQRKTSFYFFFHCKFYVYLAFAQNIISSQGK